MHFSETQEQILDAAMDVIVRDGLDSTSMRAVAEGRRVTGPAQLPLRRQGEAGRGRLPAGHRTLDAAHRRPYGGGRRRSPSAVKAALRSWFDPEFSDPHHLEMWLAIWAVSRTNDEVAVAERDLYDRCAAQLNAAIKDVDRSLSPDAVGRRTTDVLALQNGLWINWNRWADEGALERAFTCESIAFGDVT